MNISVLCTIMGVFHLSRMVIIGCSFESALSTCFWTIPWLQILERDNCSREQIRSGDFALAHSSARHRLLSAWGDRALGQMRNTKH
jgi:hypothetical protein